MASLLPTSDPLNYGNRPGDGPLRVGGESRGMPATAQNLPSTLSPVAAKQVAALEMVRDLFDGPEKVRERATRYLPKDPGEDSDNYSGRLARSVFFNAFRQTIDGMVGFIVRRDPVLGDDVPPDIAEDWENIDGAGTHGDVFCRELLQDAATAGHAAIFVDFPRTDGQQTALDEMRAIRPYWVPIRKEHLVSWRTENENGRIMLTQVVLKECQSVPDGAFGEREQVRYRVVRRDRAASPPVTYTLLEVTKANEIVLVDAGAYLNQVEIPLVEITTTGKRGLFDSTPPLLDLAYLNVAHYQQWSDYANSLHKTCVPIFTTIGATMPARGEGVSTQVLGPNTGLALPTGGDAKYVVHDGQALGACKAALDDLKTDMATMGLSLLSPAKRVAETADAKKIDKAASDSAVAVLARSLQDALERALGYHAAYLNTEGGSVTINRDFDQLTLSPQQVTALSTLVANGQLSIETLWATLAAGNVLPDDFDVDTERALLAADAEIKAATAPAPMPAPAAGANAVNIEYGPDGKPTRLTKAAA